ncbi:MAG: hypothetical protein ACPG4K_00265, partial [Haloferula sp.]
MNDPRRLKMSAWLAMGLMLLSHCSKNESGTTAIGPIEQISPSSGSETTSPFPGFSWSEHPDSFKDIGKPVEYDIQISPDAS